MTEAEYHNHPAMSQTKMKVLLENPRQFYLEHIRGVKISKETTSKNLGTCLDLALTAPEAYNKLIVKSTKTTKVDGCITQEWKELISEWIKNLNAYKMDDDFFGGISFNEIAKTCAKQVIIFYEYQDIKWRMKPDYLNVKSGFFIDLKSTKATTMDEFVQDFVKYGYHVQAASYSTGIKIAYSLPYMPRAYYIAISTITGEIFAFECSDQLIHLGTLEIDRGCQIYKENLLSNAWAKDKPLTVLTLPEWKEKQILLNYNKFFGVEA